MRGDERSGGEAGRWEMGKTYSFSISLDNAGIETILCRLTWGIESTESYAVASCSAVELESYTIEEVSRLS